MFGKKTSDAAAGLLLKRNIRFHPGYREGGIDVGSRTISAGNNRFPFDLLLYYAPTAPPPFIRESGLAGEAGWLQVDRHTMALPEDDSISVSYTHLDVYKRQSFCRYSSSMAFSGKDMPYMRWSILFFESPSQYAPVH